MKDKKKKERREKTKGKLKLKRRIIAKGGNTEKEMAR